LLPILSVDPCLIQWLIKPPLTNPRLPLFSGPDFDYLTGYKIPLRYFSLSCSICPSLPAPPNQPRLIFPSSLQILRQINRMLRPDFDFSCDRNPSSSQFLPYLHQPARLRLLIGLSLISRQDDSLPGHNLPGFDSSSFSCDSCLLFPGTFSRELCFPILRACYCYPLIV